MNENTDIKSRKSLTADTHSITLFDLGDKPSVIIRNESASNPYSKDMLISNVYIDEDSQLFETTRRRITVSLNQGGSFHWL